MVFYILIHFLPIFLVIIGFFAKAFFFYKVKWLWYRVLLIPSLFIDILYLNLIFKDLTIIFFTGTIIDQVGILSVGPWEKYHVLKLVDEIKDDILFYYLYRHRKIISYRFRFKDLYFLTKDPKSLKYLLFFFAFFGSLIIVVIENALSDNPFLAELIKDLINKR